MGHLPALLLAALVISRAHAECGGKLTNSTGVITSPNYPHYYNRREHCNWTIDAPEGQRVRLTSSHFVLEDDEDCDDDYLLLYDGETLKGRLCGLNTFSFLTNTTGARVEFHSDRSIAHQGFSIQYRFEPAGGDCDVGLFLGKGGVISSPGYPSNYPDDLDCRWEILVPPENHDIHLTVTHLHLERTCACDKDWLAITEVWHNGTEAEKGRFCLGPPPPVIRSRARSLRVRFHSDRALSAPGFELRWTAVCGGDLDSAGGGGGGGVIASSNYPLKYLNNERCVWNITAPEGHRVRLNFTDVSIEDSDDCEDYLEVFEGLPPNATSVRKFCGEEQPDDILSKGSALHLVFKTDSYDREKGFNITYTFELPDQ